MAFTVKLTPGYVFTGSEMLTYDMLNRLGNPTIDFEGGVGSLALGDGSVTTPKLADAAVTTQKVADAGVTAAKLDEQARHGVNQYAAATLGGVAYAATLSPAPAAYTEGMVVRCKFGSANPASATLNCNGLGAKALRNGAVALAAGVIQAGDVVSLVYDGVGFQVGTTPRRFASAAYGLTAGTVINANHGLGGAPYWVRCVLVCTDGGGDAGYHQYDEVDAGAVLWDTGADINAAVAWGAGPLNVWCVLAGTGSLKVRNFGTGVAAVLTAAKWQVKLYCGI